MLNHDAILQNRYRILRQLGQGGMGRVYLAEDQRFGSKVALKEARLERDDARQAFAREAGLLHRLRHPALPVVMDYFTERQWQYLVMQFIPGHDLETLLIERLENNRGTFPIGQVLQWTEQLLDVLEYLHKHQPPIIHRDIKPQNLKLTPRGEVILLDFGLAKGAMSEMSKSSISLHGYSRHYAPLEQMNGKGTDARSDLYSLAATIYRLVTGEIPPDAMARRASLASGQVDPLLPANELNPQVPAAVAAAISCALAQNPDERPSTANEMRQMFRQSIRALAPNNSDSRVTGEQYPQTETSTLFAEEAGSVITLPESGPKLVSTYAGQTMPAPDSPTCSVPGSQVNPHSAGRRPRTVRLLLIVVSVLILASAATALWVKREKRISPSPTYAEVIRYCLVVEAASGKAMKHAVDQPLAVNQRFKLQFTPREPGYLYIIAPNVKERTTTFLTARADSIWGVETNRVSADANYNFPSRQDQWLRITGQAEIETYLIIFASASLPAPGFLIEPARHELTEFEQRELAAFRQRHQTEVIAQQDGDQCVITAPKDQVDGAPLIFEINIKRRIKPADQEGMSR